jgi:hypothetical protein
MTKMATLFLSLLIASLIFILPLQGVVGGGWAADVDNCDDPAGDCRQAITIYPYVVISEVLQLLKDTREHLTKFDYPVGTTAEYDACTYDYICARQRELDRKRREREVADRIDTMIKLLEGTK